MDASKYYTSNTASPEEGKHHEQHEGHGHKHEHSHLAQGKKSKDFDFSSITGNKVAMAAITLAIALVIICIAIYLRDGLLANQGLFEPDGFFYYSVIRATINNHLVEPQYLGISGFPAHNFIGEAPGLPYLTVIFYLLIGWTGVGYLTIMRLLPVLFAIIEMALAYYIVKELSNSRVLGLLAMFFIAVSSGNIARTAALVYRGDSFITVPLMIALYLLIRAFKTKDEKKTIAYALLGATALSMGILIWNGSPFVIAIYMFALSLVVLYSFIKGDSAISRKALIAIACLLATWALQNAYVTLHGARSGLQLQGNSFMIFYLPIVIAAAVSYYILEKMRSGAFSSKLNRAMLSGIAVLALILLVGLLFHNYISGIATAAGVSQPPPTNNSQAANIIYAVGSTTQELQKPSYSFLFASFGEEIMLSIIGILLFFVAGGTVGGEENKLKNGFFGSVALVAFIVLISYFFVTAYLQYNAIRYNALVSIPIAIFAAYGAYAIYRVVSFASRDGGHDREGRKPAALIGAVACTAMVAFLLVSWAFVRAPALIAIFVGIEIVAMALLSALMFALVFKAPAREDRRMHYLAILLFAIFILGLVGFCIKYGSLEAFNSVQADGINPQFLSAMTWMKNNTPLNSTVLALWPDGSVVEGWGNRTSYMDSVGGENGTRIYYFARFLANQSVDNSYISAIHPDYLVSRQYWLAELDGLLSEGVLSNVSAYTYEPMYPFNISHNSTAAFYRFTNGYYNVTIVANGGLNGTTNWSGYVGSGYELSRIGRIVLYNASDYNYTITTSNEPSVNYTFVMMYTRGAGGNQIGDSLFLTDTLYDSNLFKLVYMCNEYVCPYNSGNVTLHAVFINNDTRIFKVDYA